MAEQTRDSAFLGESYDGVATDLQQLRFEAGDVPYAEIVRRIAADRARNGVHPSASRPARTTVYDAFRLDRRRVNPKLVGEIARALGATEVQVSQWETRCLAVRKQLEHELDAPQDAAAPVDAVGTATHGDDDTHVELPVDEALPTPKRPGWRSVTVLIAACIGINILGFWIVPLLGLPLYLDMVGTAIASLALGPWYGVFVGVSTNVIGVSITDSSSLAFSLVNAAGALVWGYGARRFRIFESISRYLLLNAVVAVVCTVVASALLVVIFHGGTGHASESTTERLVVMGEPPTLAVFISNLIHSLADKLIAGFAVLAVLDRIGRWFNVPQATALQRSSDWVMARAAATRRGNPGKTPK